jgi:hypothetical protein
MIYNIYLHIEKKKRPSSTHVKRISSHHVLSINSSQHRTVHKHMRSSTHSSKRIPTTHTRSQIRTRGHLSSIHHLSSMRRVCKHSNATRLRKKHRIHRCVRTHTFHYQFCKLENTPTNSTRSTRTPRCCTRNVHLEKTQTNYKIIKKGSKEVRK